jgi:hypothetical protein
VKKGIIVLWIIYIIIILTNVLCAQPFHYYSVKIGVDSTSEYPQSIFKIIKYNIKTGEEGIYLKYSTIDKTVLDPTRTWILFADYREGSKILSSEDTSKVIYISYDLLPHVIRYSRAKNKLYVIGNNRRDNIYDTKMLTVIDINSGEDEKSLTLPESTWEYNTPFFSTDESKLYILIQDSTGIDYNDKTKIVEFSTATNSIIAEKELKNVGYPGAKAYTLERGRKGKGIILSGYRPNIERYYQIYDFEKGTSSAFVFSPVNADAYMLGEECQYLALVELKQGKLTSGTPYYVPSGIVKIYDANTARLIKTLTYPEEYLIKFYDDYPNDIYPLGVEVNGVVSKFSTDSLVIAETRNDLTAKVQASITQTGNNLQFTYTVINDSASRQQIANVYISDVPGATQTAPTGWQTEKTGNYLRYFTSETNKEIAPGALLAGYTNTGNLIPVFGRACIQSKRNNPDTSDVRTNSYIAETVIGISKTGQTDSKKLIDSLLSYNSRALSKGWIKFSWVKDNNYYQLNNAKTMINMNIPASAVIILTAFENWIDTAKGLGYFTEEGYGILKYNSIYLREILSGQ